MKKYDTNHDGMLSKREVYFMLKDLSKIQKMDLIGSKLEVVNFFNKIDVDNSGYLDNEEEMIALTEEVYGMVRDNLVNERNSLNVDTKPQKHKLNPYYKPV